MELLAFVAFAASESSHWAGELVLYVTDNENVRSWLVRRRPRNPFARLLVCLEFSFSCHSVYVRTYRNVLADWLSREDPSFSAQDMVRQGWTQVFPTENPYWTQFVIHKCLRLSRFLYAQLYVKGYVSAFPHQMKVLGLFSDKGSNGVALRCRSVRDAKSTKLLHGCFGHALIMDT